MLGSLGRTEGLQGQWTCCGYGIRLWAESSKGWRGAQSLGIGNHARLSVGGAGKELGVQGLGFGVSGLGGLGFRDLGVKGLGFRKTVRWECGKEASGIQPMARAHRHIPGPQKNVK